MIANPSPGIWSLGYASVISTLGTSVLSWNTSGNVGIGTMSPQNRLEVNGDTIFDGNTYTNCTPKQWHSNFVVEQIGDSVAVWVIRHIPGWN